MTNLAAQAAVGASTGQATITQMIDEVANRTGLNPGSCELLVGTVFSVLAHEDQAHANAVFAEVPGALELAQAHDVMAATPPENTGLLGKLVHSVSQSFGEPMQAAINGMEQLTRTGFSMEQMQTAVKVLLSQLSVAAGPATVSNMLASAPMLKARLGL